MSTAEELIAFEDEVAALFNAGRIRAPVHLYSGNEAQMIEMFRDVGRNDWAVLLLAQPLPVPAQGRAARAGDGRDPRRALDLAVLPRIPHRTPRRSSAASCPSRWASRWRFSARRGRARALFHGRDDRRDRHRPRVHQVQPQPPAADPVHRRGQREVGLHRHPRGVEPAEPELREPARRLHRTTTATRPAIRTPAPASGCSFEAVR